MNGNSPVSLALSSRSEERQGRAPSAGGFAGALVPDHELLRVIGRGAYGEVWMARNALGTLRAAKIVHLHAFEQPECFEREFNGLQKFEPVSRSHESLVDILQIGRNTEGDCFYYVMELADDASSGGEAPSKDSEFGRSLEGRTPVSDVQPYRPRTLRSDLRSRGPLPASECMALGLKLAAGLEFLHSQGLIHRDIKPSNIIFVGGEPKLADVGLVANVEEARSMVGTAGYIPPEGPGTPQGDIFSLGKVLYEAAFGKDRLEFPQLPADLERRADHQALLELNQVILRACESDPRKRYSSASEMRAELGLLEVGISVKGRRRRRQRVTAAKVLLALGLVAGVLAVAIAPLWRRLHPTQPVSANPEAQRLYSLACYELQNKALDRLLAAYTNLTDAVRLDPGFVDAYFKLFEIYFGPLGDRLPPHYNQFENFRSVVAKLREISPNSAQYHTANSLIEFLEWKFDKAIAEAVLAIQLDPNFLRAHGFYAWYVLCARADTTTALHEYRKAERLDPADTTIQSLLGGPFYVDHRFDLAINQFRQAVELERRNPFAHLNLGDAYRADAQYDKALQEYEQADVLCGADAEKTKARYQTLRGILNDRGPEGLWRAMLREAATNPSADPYLNSELHALLGEKEQAIQLLNEAYKRHDGRMIFLLGEPSFDSLRGERGFQELVNRMGFRPVARGN